jgi:hypothetical protein
MGYCGTRFYLVISKGCCIAGVLDRVELLFPDDDANSLEPGDNDKPTNKTVGLSFPAPGDNDPPPFSIPAHSTVQGLPAQLRLTLELVWPLASAE